MITYVVQFVLLTQVVVGSAVFAVDKPASNSAAFAAAALFSQIVVPDELTVTVNFSPALYASAVAKMCIRDRFYTDL